LTYAQLLTRNDDQRSEGVQTMDRKQLLIDSSGVTLAVEVSGHGGQLSVCQSALIARGKLTAEQVQMVRQRLASGPRGTQAALARELGVTDGVIWSIKVGKTWSWLPQNAQDMERTGT